MYIPFLILYTVRNARTFCFVLQTDHGGPNCSSAPLAAHRCRQPPCPTSAGQLVLAKQRRPEAPEPEAASQMPLPGGAQPGEARSPPALARQSSAHRPRRRSESRQADAGVRPWSSEPPSCFSCFDSEHVAWAASRGSQLPGVMPT